MNKDYKLRFFGNFNDLNNFNSKNIIDLNKEKTPYCFNKNLFIKYKKKDNYTFLKLRFSKNSQNSLH